MNMICPHCGVTNKVNPERLGEAEIKCGKCKDFLEPDAPGFPVDVDQSNFTAEVKKSGKPVLVDFWSPTCPPCRQLAPVLTSLAKEMVGKLKVAKLNVEAQPAAASVFGIKGVPTLILFKDGKNVAQTVGYHPIDELKAFVSQAL